MVPYTFTPGALGRHRFSLSTTIVRRRPMIVKWSGIRWDFPDDDRSRMGTVANLMPLTGVRRNSARGDSGIGQRLALFVTRDAMRPDMAKVIVERPRFGSRTRGTPKGYRRTLQRLGDEGLPHREGMKRRHQGNTKSLNEHLGPLRRYLDAQVGRPWDKVFSEICAHIDRASAVQDHVRDHVADYVVTHVVLIDGIPCSGDGRSELWTTPSPVVQGTLVRLPTHANPQARQGPGALAPRHAEDRRSPLLRPGQRFPPVPPDRWDLASLELEAVAARAEWLPGRAMCSSTVTPRRSTPRPRQTLRGRRLCGGKAEVGPSRIVPVPHPMELWT